MFRNSDISRKQNKDSAVDKNRIIYCLIMSFLFALSLVCGYQLQNSGITMPGFGGKAVILLISLLITVPVFAVFYFVIYLIDSSFAKVYKRSNYGSDSETTICFLIAWACIFVAWLPVFMAYYPCVMSSDFDVQLSQVIHGHSSYTNHHPYLSTLEIEFFYNLKDKLGTVRKAVAALGIWHIFALSSAFAYSTLTIYKLLQKKWVAVVWTLAVIIYPVNPVLGLSTTKDVIFSTVFMYFTCLLVNQFVIAANVGAKQENGDKNMAGVPNDNSKARSVTAESILNHLGLIITGVLMCSYRNNAVYAIAAAALIALIFANNKTRLWLVCMTAVILVSFSLLKTGIEHYLGVSHEGNSPEMYSVPIQQMGRTYLYDADSLTDWEKETIEYYIPKESISKYKPAISDPLKTPVTNKTFDTHWSDMPKLISDWARIGIKHPDAYIDAFLDLTRGYWYLYDTSYATVWGADLHYRMGLLYTNNVSGYSGLDEIWHESKLPGLELVYEKILSRNDFFKWPVLNMFFRLSFYCWILAAVVGYCIYKKKKITGCIALLPLMYLATLYLGPTAYIRYVFPVMITLPILICCLIRESKENMLS